MTIEPLLEVMNQLIELHRELIALAEEKTPVLVRNDMEQLNAMIHKENKLVRQIAELDAKRVQVIGEYLMARSYRPDPRITVSDLTRIVFKSSEKQALAEVQSRLLSIIAELRERNERNQKLIEQSLAFINFSVDLLVEDPNENLMYRNPNGQAYSPPRSGMFDTKA